ncbi:MAG: prolipoprotein diacylglyceryl transferase [Flavobacteriales bacterium]
MYPTISEFLKSFGINLPLPIQTFGFFVALAFLFAAYTLGLELKRKTNEGLLIPQKKKVIENKPITWYDYAINAGIGFLLGFKLVFAFLNYSYFASNPQEVILSGMGSIPGGIGLAAILVYLKYREAQQLKGKTPKEKWVEVQPYELVSNITLIAALFGLLGAKVFHNLENIDEFFQDPIDALLSFSGLTFYGGLIVAAVAVIRYGKKNGIPPLHIADAAAPGLMLAYGIGRIGCHASGDGDWGIVNSHPKPDFLGFLPDWMWSFKYPHNVNQDGVPIPGCEGRYCFELPEAVWPTPFYEAIMGITLFFILWSIRKRIHIPGLLFSIYLLINGMERFFIEKIRVNTEYNIFGMGITQAEIISMSLILIGVAGIIYLIRVNKVKSNGIIS